MVLIAALVVAIVSMLGAAAFVISRLDASADKAVAVGGSHEQPIRILSVLAGSSCVGGFGLVWAQRWRRNAVAIGKFNPQCGELTLADGTQNVELTKDAAGWQVQAIGYVRRHAAR